MEERGAETNGHDDPIGSPKISLKFFLNDLERPEAKASGFVFLSEPPSSGKYGIIYGIMSESKAVYPGTFDPMTKGHFDLISRAAKLYDRLVVAVAATSVKQGAMFGADERVAMIREDVRRAGLDNVEIKVLDTLLVDFCRREGAKVVIRGVRVYSDFEYEFQMALTNRRMAPEIETLFMMPSESLAYVTASTVREIARYRGDTGPFVTEAVQRHLAAEIAKEG